MVLSVVPDIDTALRARSARTLELLCDWAVAANDRPLPDAIRYRAALVLLDDLGAAIAAASEPQVVAAREIETRSSRAAEATVFASGAARLDRVGAAVANGMAATWCELDEGYRLAPCHAGACIWPALLAEAEASGASTADTLRALAIAYDITARFARAFPFAKMSVHPHAAYATIGAAAGIGLLRKLPAPQLLNALTGAASMTFAGPYGHAIDGALVRNAWTAASAWIAFRAVDWALAGISGIPETAYDVFAICFGTACDPAELERELGTRWAIQDGYHKIYACCQYAHSMIEASLDMHDRLGPDARKDIESIEVLTHPRGLTLTGVEPATVLAAKFSMPPAAAAVARLASGGQVAFSSAARIDPDISALRRRVTLTPLEKIEPWPNDRATRVVWTMRNGDRHEASCRNARGGADQPFDEATLLAKLMENVGEAFPAFVPVMTALLRSSGDDQRPWRDCVTTMMESAS
ncbi:MAG: MmgE/PrpD family protein [Beijerinckiaceae bacterium]